MGKDLNSTDILGNVQLGLNFQQDIVLNWLKDFQVIRTSLLYTVYLFIFVCLMTVLSTVPVFNPWRLDCVCEKYCSL